MVNNNYIDSILRNSFEHIFQPSNTYLFLKGDEDALKSHCMSIFRGRMVRIEIIHVVERVNRERSMPFYSDIQIQCGQNVFLKKFNTPVFEMKTSIVGKGEISIICDEIKKVQFLYESIYNKSNINGPICQVQDLRNIKSFFIDSNYNAWNIFI